MLYHLMIMIFLRFGYHFSHDDLFYFQPVSQKHLYLNVNMSYVWLQGQNLGQALLIFLSLQVLSFYSTNDVILLRCIFQTPPYDNYDPIVLYQLSANLNNYFFPSHFLLIRSYSIYLYDFDFVANYYVLVHVELLIMVYHLKVEISIVSFFQDLVYYMCNPQGLFYTVKGILQNYK